MTLSLADAALGEYLDRNPDARAAQLHDPEFAADVHRLRTVLDHLDAALTAEGLDEEARRRVGAGLVARCLPTDEVRERMRERERLARELATLPPAWTPWTR